MSASQTVSQTDTQPSVPPVTLRLQTVGLRVADLRRSKAFYENSFGLEARDGETGILHLHVAGEDTAPLMTLREQPGLRHKPAGAPGLFHVALLTPDRASLAHVLLRLAQSQTEIDGMGDHGVSEAIYLSDPDGHGLELYTDRSRDKWPYRDGKLAMYTRAVDVPSLLSTAPDRQPAALTRGTTVGHVHLQTGDIVAAEHFYTQDLGLQVTDRGYPGGLFYSADGYHHHIATNTWGPRLKATPDMANIEWLRIARAGSTANQSLIDADGLRIEQVPL